MKSLSLMTKRATEFNSHLRSACLPSNYGFMCSFCLPPSICILMKYANRHFKRRETKHSKWNTSHCDWFLCCLIFDRLSLVIRHFNFSIGRVWGFFWVWNSQKLTEVTVHIKFLIGFLRNQWQKNPFDWKPFAFTITLSLQSILNVNRFRFVFFFFILVSVLLRSLLITCQSCRLKTTARFLLARLTFA